MNESIGPSLPAEQASKTVNASLDMLFSLEHFMPLCLIVATPHRQTTCRSDFSNLAPLNNFCDFSVAYLPIRPTRAQCDDWGS